MEQKGDEEEEKTFRENKNVPRSPRSPCKEVERNVSEWNRTEEGWREEVEDVLKEIRCMEEREEIRQMRKELREGIKEQGKLLREDLGVKLVNLISNRCSVRPIELLGPQLLPAEDCGAR